MFSNKRGSPDSPTNHGPIIAVITWFLTVASFLWVLVRLGTKLAISRKVAYENLFILAALALSIGQCAAVSVQTYNGLGQHVQVLTPSQIERFQKSSYASNLLFIGSLCCAKLSVLQLLQTISPFTYHHKAALVLGLTILLWAITSEFVVGFQCSVPETWNTIGSQCINYNVFWTYYGVLNILTDIALILLPLAIIWKLQVNRKCKLSIACCFGARVLVIASAIAQLKYLPRNESLDLTYHLWPSVLCNQLVQNIGIIAACVPYIKPFFESLESGMIRTDDLRRRGLSTAYGYSSFSKPSNGRLKRIAATSSSAPYELGLQLSASAAANTDVRENVPTTEATGSRDIHREIALHGQNVAIVTVGSPNLETRLGSDAESHNSSSAIIKQTKTWDVER